MLKVESTVCFQRKRRRERAVTRERCDALCTKFDLNHVQKAEDFSKILQKTPAHPPEATYPCCIPALGGLGDVVPRGGSTYITRFWLQVERKSQASAPLGALLGAPHAFTMFFCSLNICIKLRLICLNISSNIALNEFARLAIFMLNSWRLHKVGARSQNRTRKLAI